MNRAFPLVPFFILASGLVIAKPIREAPKTATSVISAKNAATVAKVNELARDVTKIVWMPNRQLALLTWEKPIAVLEAHTLKEVGLLADGKKPINFAVNSDGSMIAWCENSTKVELHDVRAGKRTIIETENPQPQPAFSSNKKMLATGGYGTQAKLWNTATGALIRRLDCPGAGGLRVAFSPDDNLVAVGNRNSVTRVFEVETGKLLHSLPRRSSHGLKFSPDGKMLAVAYVDGSIGLWDAATGRLAQCKQTTAEELYSLDWSPAGDVLATAGRQGKITLWDPRNLDVLKELESPEWVNQVRFSLDGSRLLSSGGTIMRSPDRRVTVWGLPPGR